jgi:hypothetical protein
MAKVMKWGETVKVLLDVGFIANAFELDESRLDDVNAVLDGSTDFVDITEYVTSVNINRGRATQLDPFNSGNCSITADDKAAERRFDPLNTDSVWYQGSLGIAPKRQVQVYGGSAGTAAMFSGYIFDMNIDYAEPQLSSAAITAVDALAQISQTTLVGFSPSSELTSDRVNTILNRSEVAWSTALRSIATGQATCGTVAYEDATNALAALQAVQFAEDGRLFATRSGLIEFDSRIATSFGTAVASLGGTAVGAIPILSLSNLYGAETVVNRASVQISGGTVSSIANGTASQTEYGIKNFSLTDIPLATQAAGSALAENLVGRFSEPVVKFNEATVLVNMLTAAQQEQIAALEIGDILSVTRVFESGAPLTVSQNVVVESISHRLSPARHEVNIGLGQIQLITPFILDTSQLDDTTVGLQ